MTEEQEGAKPLSELTYEELVAYLDTGWPWPLSAVQEWFEELWDNIQEWVYEYCQDALARFFRWASDVWDTLKDKVTDVIEDFFDYATWFWNKLEEWVEGAIEYTFKHFDWFWEEVGDWFDWVWGKVKDRFNWLLDEIEDWFDWLWTEIGKKFTWIGGKFQELGDWLWENISVELSGILGMFGPIGIAIAAVIPSLTTEIQDSRDSMVTVFGVEIDKVPELFKTHVEDPLTDFFDTWIADMLAGLGSLWDTIWTTMQTWWTVVTEFFTEDLVPGIVAGFRWISDWFAEAIDSVMDSVFGWLRSHSPMTPEDAPSSAIGLMTVLGISGIGLGVMTAAGQLMHPLATWNLGHLSAMIGDVINYRTITGVIMGAVIGGGIRTPLTYYVNDLLRPWLPDKGQTMEMRSRQLIDRSRFEKLEAYYGYGDEWMDYLDSMTEAGVGYFALAAIADTGYFDEPLFDRDLKRRGYAQEMINAMLTMYESVSLGEAKGMFSGTAITGFKEGHYEEPELRIILGTLGYKEPGLSRMVFAANLAYEIDYRSDMLAAYREAFRKDQITEAEFRSSLAELPLVPERIDGYVFREMVKKIGKVKL